uniref:Uncharacterized protein n=1 Tax=Spongospora subterranea TaxID=70186 RepID=A0A0H5QX17_9EUKA|eukprot:CRZ06523.1 hypothetical protein [Spongospora subterranea]
MTDVGDGEIVGLHDASNGRSCESHRVCGEYLESEMLVLFKHTILCTSEGTVENGVACYRIRDGVQSCRVGFLPRNIVARSKDDYEDKFAQILQLYNESDNVAKRNKSHRNKGMASFRLLDVIPLNE